MGRIISRFFGVVIRIVLCVVVLSFLVSIGVSMGVIDAGPAADSTIETPEPLPDWSFVWEIPIDGDSGADLQEQSDSADRASVGDPVQGPPGTTRIENGQASISSNEIEVRVHKRVNVIRTENNLSKLEHSGEIATISRTYSYDMGEREYFSHVSPEGERPDDRFGDLYPSKCHAIGENLARLSGVIALDADDIAERVVDGWMNSKGHRKNILTDKWDSQGIGVYIDGRSVYVTQEFCDEW